VTLTPELQLDDVSVADAGTDTDVSPVRDNETVTLAGGAALSLTFNVAEPPSLTDSEAGVSEMDGFCVPVTEKETAVVVVDAAGLPLSTARAAAVWLPTAIPVALKEYGSRCRCRPGRRR
jgi:hypothetical protein